MICMNAACIVHQEARAIARSTITRGDLSVLDICDLITKSRPDDVRWDKVEHVKRILTSETYPVSPTQIAAKLIEHMLEHGRVNQRWKHSGSSGEIEDSSGIAKATIAGQAKQTR
jgi:anti-sigma28 factor (negative regulator of flagellin synthesis)